MNWTKATKKETGAQVIVNLDLVRYLYRIKHGGTQVTFDDEHHLNVLEDADDLLRNRLPL